MADKREEKSKWPGVSINDEDYQIIESLRAKNGPFRGIDRKDAMMIAAAIALRNDLPESGNALLKCNNQIIHPSLLNGEGYDTYRQYISLIFFHGKGKKDLDSMNDTAAMVSNFIDYSHRGLMMLKANYIDSNNTTNEELYKEFIEALDRE